MFLFLIELYLLGVLATRRYSGKLPNFFLAVSSVLLGYLAYVLNGFLLVLVGVPLTRFSMILMVSLEIVGLLAVGILRKDLIRKNDRQLWWSYLLVGVGHLGVAAFFYINNFFFVTTDSVYLVVMARNLLESGFSKWYFSSPRGMGLFVPFLQTLGMLFGRDYTWFVQPVFMAAFLALFVFFGLRVGKLFIQRKSRLYLLVGAVTLLMFSADLFFIMTTYIHTNFNSGLFLFLTVVTLYFGIKEDNSSWLAFTTLGLIGFGMMRVENVIFALVLILIFTASGKIAPRLQRRTFLPYLVFQFGLYLRIFFMHPNTYSDQMSDGQILITLAGIFVVGVLLFLTEIPLLKRKLFPSVYWLLPAGLLLLVVGLGALNPDQLFNNLGVNLKTIFMTGNWGAVWWVVIILFALLPVGLSFPLKRELNAFMLSFFVVIELLGLFRVPYHARWYDSANRILIHIIPLVLFTLIIRIASAVSRDRTGEMIPSYSSSDVGEA